MDFTKKELQDLVSMVNVFRNERERNLRRIRRNFDAMVDKYNSIPDELAYSDGIEHPSDEIERLKSEKAKAVILKNKLVHQIKSMEK